MIPGATISIGGEALVTTGTDGRFQIRNFPSGVYDWQINASGYYTAEYSNYDVDYLDGATIFTFYISDDFAVQKDRDEILRGDACQQQELSAAETDGEDGIRPSLRQLTARSEFTITAQYIQWAGRNISIRCCPRKYIVQVIMRVGD